MQEWMGYLLTPDTRHHKILMMVGATRGGKTTIERVIRAMVGLDNVASPMLSTFGTNFGLSGLLGKSVAIISDARASKRGDSNLIVERLLTISGEGTLLVDTKYGKLSDYKFNTRLIIISNEVPDLKDASGALAGRMLVLRFTKSFKDKEDKRLIDKLLAELPSILLWSIKGWARLRERGHFVQPEGSGEVLTQLEEMSSPILAFIKECCVEEPNRRMPKKDLFKRFQVWAEEKGLDSVSDNTFGKELFAARPEIGDKQVTIDGKKVRCYLGIALKDDQAYRMGSR